MVDLTELRWVLVAEGTTDRALEPILQWILERYFSTIPIHRESLDLRDLPRPPRDLDAKILTAINMTRCHLIFIHRDADDHGWESRLTEIQVAWGKAQARLSVDANYIPVIPIRETEAWFLLDKEAIRTAAENPRGRIDLTLPRIQDIENLRRPKEHLYDLLRQANDQTGRRFNPKTADCLLRLVNAMEEFGSFERLRSLTAFQELEKRVSTLAGRWRDGSPG